MLAFDPTLPSVIICDLEGTLLTDNEDFIFDGLPNEQVAHALDVMTRHTSVRVVLVSDLPESCREMAEKWLKDFSLSYGPLYMASQYDYRDEAIIKREFYEREIAGKFNVRFVLENSDNAVAMWRELGLNCWQVNADRTD